MGGRGVERPLILMGAKDVEEKKENVRYGGGGKKGEQ